MNEFNFSKLRSDLNRINTQFDESLRAEREYNTAKDQAVFDTAEHLKSINSKVANIDDGLSDERTERMAADQKAMKYTKKWNKINLAIGIIGILLAIFALFKS